MLPEASYFTDRRAYSDFDRCSIVNHNDDKSDKNCFGFDMDDDIELVSASKTETICREVKSTNNSSSASALNDARAKLKRFLHGSNPNSHLSASNQLCEKANNQNQRNEVNNAVKEKSKLFLDLNESDGLKQKDIRSAFAAKPYHSNVDEAIPSTSKQNLPVLLFEDTGTVC